MKQIEEVVRRAALRMGWNHANWVAGRAICGTVALACLIILADKLIFLGAPAYYVLAAMAGCIAIVAVWLARRAWPSRSQAAMEIDDRLRLGERVSTAMAVAKDPIPMARAVIADTRAYAKAVPVKVTFPMKLHREYWIAFVLAFAALGLLCLPHYDLLARKHKREVALKEKEEVKREAEGMRTELAKIREDVKQLKDRRVMDHLDELDKVVQNMEKGKLSRADALAKLNELGDALKKEQQALYDKKKFAFSPASRKQGLSLTKDLAKALENKDFARAAKELKALAQKASEGRLSKDEQEKLNKELQALAQQLGDAKELGEALEKLAAQMKEVDAEALKKALAQANLELDKLADMEKELAALSQCQGLCQGAGKGLAKKVAITDMAGIYNTGDGRSPGAGMGGPGMGQGGVAPVQPHSVNFQPGKIQGKMRKGRIVGSFFSDGKNLKGEAKVPFVAEAVAAEVEAAAALQNEQVPRAYENYVREYFHDMKGQ